MSADDVFKNYGHPLVKRVVGTEESPDGHPCYIVVWGYLTFEVELRRREVGGIWAYRVVKRSRRRTIPEAA